MLQHEARIDELVAELFSAGTVLTLNVEEPCLNGPPPRVGPQAHRPQSRRRAGSRVGLLDVADVPAVAGPEVAARAELVPQRGMTPPAKTAPVKPGGQSAH